jgi:TRAP-type C4-dicarboxylate transport system substrate-binding protein
MTSRTYTARALGIAAAVAMMTAAGASTAADFTMKIGLATFKDVQHNWAMWYKDAVEKRSGGRIAVNIFPRSQLGKVPRQIEGVQLGSQQVFVAPTDFFAGVDPRYGVFSIPVLFKNKLHAGEVLKDPELNKEILALGDDEGLVGASVFTHSTAHYFGKKPIRRLSDFKGLKLRVNATAAEREKMRRFGASAVPMPLSEVVPALQRGVIDGTMSGAVVYVIFKFNSIGKVLTRTDDTLIISTSVLSKTWLNKLPADLRRIVVEEGPKLQGKATEFSHANEKFFLGKWKELGGSLITLPADDLAKIRSMLASVGKDVTKDNPKVNAFRERIIAVGSKY